MEIKNVFETPDGAVEFHGKLNPDEVAYYLMVGMAYVARQGALPIAAVKEQNIASIAAGSEEYQ